MFETTTYISDSLEMLNQLADRLNHIPFMPQEQVLGLITSGAIIIDEILNGYDPQLLTVEEAQFILRMNARLTEELQEISGTLGENHE